jgi:hypothetical protein
MKKKVTLKPNCILNPHENIHTELSHAFNCGNRSLIDSILSDLDLELIKDDEQFTLRTVVGDFFLRGLNSAGCLNLSVYYYTKKQS